MKIALVGFGLWSMFSTLRQLTKLIRVQKHLINILDEVRKG